MPLKKAKILAKYARIPYGMSGESYSKHSTLNTYQNPRNNRSDALWLELRVFRQERQQHLRHQAKR